MAKRNKAESGKIELIKLTNPLAVTANAVLLLFGLVVIAFDTYLANKEGMYIYKTPMAELPKPVGQAQVAGAPLYFNSTNVEFTVLREVAVGAPVPGGGNVGTGVVTGQALLAADALEETVTLKCTAVAVNGGTFSVVGDKSGQHPDVTVGTLYKSGPLTFTIGDGGTDFAVNDVITLAITANKRCGMVMEAALGADTTVMGELSQVA